LPGEYVIRRGTVRDAAALAAFGARTFEEAFAAHNRPDDMTAYLAKNYGAEQQRRELEDPRIVTLIVENAGKLIGFAQIRRDSDDAVEIARFYVDQGWQGRGIAQALMDAIDEAAESLRVSSIWLGVWERNGRAISFYAKCGFRDVGSHPFLLGNDLQTDRVMSRAVRTVNRKPLTVNR
jgi:diamine N-acetyltransferase